MCGEAADTGSLFSWGAGRWHEGYTEHSRSCEERRESEIEALGPVSTVSGTLVDPPEGENWLYAD